MLPTPAHFEQASQLVAEDQIAEKIACGPDVETHIAGIQPYLDAGFEEIYIPQVGPDQAGFMRFWRDELQPALAEVDARAGMGSR